MAVGHQLACGHYPAGMSDDEPLYGAQHVLCVLGAGPDLGTIGALGADAGFRLDREYSSDAPDEAMPAAFRACADATFGEDDRDAVAAHGSVGYLVGPRFLPPGTEDAVARRALALVADVLRAGAVAVKHESSLVAHGRERWLALAADGDTAGAFVRLPIRSGNLLYSTGMHLLGRPDVELAHDGDRTRVPEWVELMHALVAYQVVDDEPMADGEGFRLAPDAPRWVLRRTGCTRFEPDDLSYNPYGYWRLEP
ncbi:hypothetical protein GCM10022220_71130 [Actinocatenispora rupis]|uniref:DUF4261 domain-containing protein n=2 Tax=Actinocatenispora rupis TaxID=519421 RepID=A0A8J3JD70_9ACTN|nr:hypothetical protein Aru02nite_71440 [Actinocatenispora rupis]